MDASYIAAARGRGEEFERVMQSDRASDRRDSTDRGWIPPPKGDGQS